MVPLVRWTNNKTPILCSAGILVKMRTNKVWCLVCWRLGVKSSVSLSKYDFESALKTREQRKVKQIEEVD